MEHRTIQLPGGKRIDISIYPRAQKITFSQTTPESPFPRMSTADLWGGITPERAIADYVSTQ